MEGTSGELDSSPSQALKHECHLCGSAPGKEPPGWPPSAVHNAVARIGWS